MTYDEFIERVHAIGYDVHLNDGVWWIETSPFFYEPVIPYQTLEYGSARPKWYKALLGYGYLVSDHNYAKRYRSIMLLDNEKLQNFTIDKLPSKRRNKIRKGLKLTVVSKIEDIEKVIDDLRDIFISKAKRTGHGKPPEYYINHYDEWKSSIIKQFNVDKGKKEYWGAFFENKLIAFFTMVPLNDTMIINEGASHSDHLDKCPNDALRFKFLQYCQNRQDCSQVISGLWSDNKPSLNEFKESYGFVKVDLPFYAKYHLNILPIIKSIVSINQFHKIKQALMSYLNQRKK